MRNHIVRVTYQNQAGGCTVADSIRMTEEGAKEYQRQVLGKDWWGKRIRNPFPVLYADLVEVKPIKLRLPNPNHVPGQKRSPRYVIKSDIILENGHA